MPKLETQNLFLNPVNPNYFYMIKCQGIDSDIEFHNYVLAEDYVKINEKIDELKNVIIESDEDDSGTEAEHHHDDKRDFFELALQSLREAKDYNVGKFIQFTFFLIIYN